MSYIYDFAIYMRFCRGLIIDSSSLFPITKKLNDDANERKSYQKRLLFKANDYLCKQNNKRSLLMQKLATKSNSLVSKSLPV